MEDNAKKDNANGLGGAIAEAKAKAIAEPSASGEYVFTRSATIMHRENYSEFRKANMAYLSDGASKIGSAIRSYDRMRVNKAELDVYMPTLIGEHHTSPNYNKRVDEYFSNLAVIVTPGGKVLDISIRFNSKHDFDNFDKEYSKILTKFNSSLENVGSTGDVDKLIDEIYKVKDEAIVNLEAKVHNVGFPINVADYILWRYCLVYRDVANDEIRVSKSENIRFYIYNKELKEKQEKSKFEIQSKATLKYADLLINPANLEVVLWALSNVHAIDVKAAKDATSKAMMLDKIVKSDPQGFITTANAKDLETRAFIEKAVSHGMVNRIPNTQVLMDKEGNTLASTLQEAIVYFRNRELNGEFITRIENQLKSL